MSQAVEPVDEKFQAQSRAALEARFGETNVLWQRQSEVVKRLRDGIETGAIDPVDRATMRAQADEQALLEDSLGVQVAEISTAIDRCDRGVYGICERCQQRIPAERLEMFPAATHCVPCKELLPRR